MADDRTLPFKERAYQNYRDEMENLKKVEVLLRRRNRDEVEEYREPLSRDKRKGEVTVLLSWGGPSDGYKVYFGRKGQLKKGYYFFADWFEYEEIRLSAIELGRVQAVYLSDYFAA